LPGASAYLMPVEHVNNWASDTLSHWAAQLLSQKIEVGY